MSDRLRRIGGWYFSWCVWFFDDWRARLGLAFASEALVVVAFRLEQLHEVRLAIQMTVHRRKVLQTENNKHFRK